MNFEQVIYKGQFENYAISGFGVRYYNDSYYEGNLIKDRKEGKGSLIYKDGEKYEGEWMRSEERRVGKECW